MINPIQEYRKIWNGVRQDLNRYVGIQRNWAIAWVGALGIGLLCGLGVHGRHYIKNIVNPQRTERAGIEQKAEPEDFSLREFRESRGLKIE